jgi:hypothetical protein
LGGVRGRSRGLLLNGGWMIAAILAAMIASDRIERRAHTPLCIEACESAGLVFVSVPTAQQNSIRCDCRGRYSVDTSAWSGHVSWSRRTISVAMSWSEYLRWHEVTLMIVIGIVATIAGVRWLWRRDPEHGGPPFPR